MKPRLILVFLVLISASPGLADESGSQSAANAARPEVTGLSGELRIGREIVVDVAHLSDWATRHDPGKLVPYLNGRPLERLYPEQIDLPSNRLRFHLRVPPESKQVWGDLLHEPVLRRSISLSVGLENESPFDTIFDENNPASLTVIPKTSGVIVLLLVLISLPLFVLLVRTTDILREPGPQPPRGQGKRFSLSRAQTALWFYLVSIAYVCLWLITGDFNTLTPSVLTLIGINAVTAVTTHVMHGNDKAAQSENGDVQSADVSKEFPSKGFFPDVLTDANGYGIHRFQMVAWTIVFGVIFIFSAYHNLAMPNFSNALLALMGVSAATFVGFESIQQKVFERIAAAGV